MVPERHILTYHNIFDTLTLWLMARELVSYVYLKESKIPRLAAEILSFARTWSQFIT